MAKIVPKLLWISKRLELTFISDNYTQNQVKSEGLFENRTFRFLNPEVPNFNRYFPIQPVTHPFTIHSLSLSHFARHKHCLREAILGRFGNLTKDFKGQRWCLGDSNPEVPDPSSEIDFKSIPP